MPFGNSFFSFPGSGLGMHAGRLCLPSRVWRQQSLLLLKGDFGWLAAFSYTVPADVRAGARTTGVPGPELRNESE